MSNPIAGWYPDPAGDASKLRYWDGESWTDKFMDRPQEAEQQAEKKDQQQNAGLSYTANPDYQQQGSENNPYNVQVNFVEPVYQAYEMSSQDKTLRLIAFIFALIDTISSAFLILPLAWMIPMTVHTWKIYQGKRANTVAFGVCSLIFVSLVSGILLLVSTKDK